MKIYSITRRNGTQDYYYWGLNSRTLDMAPLACGIALMQFTGNDKQNQYDRDRFWEGYNNGRHLTPADFTGDVYTTKGGAIVVYCPHDEAYTCVFPGTSGTHLGVGDVVPEDWPLTRTVK